jgi:hypothetical protein
VSLDSSGFPVVPVPANGGLSEARPRIDQINIILGPLETAISAAFGFSGSEFSIPPSGTITEFMTPGTWETIQEDLYGPLTTQTPKIAWFEAGPAHVYRAGHT